MANVTVRDLRNNGGAVLARVEAGEQITVTRDGHPVAELRPLRRPPLCASELLARWAQLPRVDAGRMRAEIDALVDQAL